jgi:predicted dienelactone hydrolase
MKWFKRIAAALAVLVLVLAVVLVTGARRGENPVGQQVARVETPDGPVAVAIWYPTTARAWPTTLIGAQLLEVAKDGPVKGQGLPLVVMSHGNSGSAFSHTDLALALASAGYVVVAPTHAGDNFADPSRQGSPALFSQRAAQLRATVDFALGDWKDAARIDATRIGAFGFSAGGFAVLTLAGGHPDLAVIPAHCQQSPEFICDVLRATGSPLVDSPEGAGEFLPDSRLRAAVVAAPGLGFTFANGGLADVQVPVQVWSGDQDQAVPYETNTQVVERELAGRAESHRIAGAAHLSFLPPCGLIGPPALCRYGAGFDRAAAHEAMNASVLAFFEKAMPKAGN